MNYCKRAKEGELLYRCYQQCKECAGIRASVGQSRRMSLVESLSNILVGYGVALLAQIIVFPLLGVQASLWQNVQIGIVFTAVSLARSYALRRLFNWIGR